MLGLATLGYRVIQTIGTKITELVPTRGFSAELAAAAGAANPGGAHGWVRAAGSGGAGGGGAGAVGPAADGSHA